MSRSKLHGLWYRDFPFLYSFCGRHTDQRESTRKFFASFNEDVTCKQCLAVIEKERLEWGVFS